MHQAGRAVVLFAKRQSRTALKVKNRPMTTSGYKGPENNQTIVASLEEPQVSTEDRENNESGPTPLDKRISMCLMRKNFTRPGLGLKSGRNRDNLVLDFFNLTKAVLEDRVKVEDFVASDTFRKLQEQVEVNIDFINNAQIVNLLSSMIKMKINPSINLVKLLEHEVRFRLKTFNLNQVIKMVKFYNTAELTAEQKQLVDVLNYRIRAYLQGEATSVQELNLVLQMVASQQAPHSLINLVEERLLTLLTIPVVDEEDMVSAYLTPHQRSYDYESLCNLFIQLAENKRRPTPLLKAATTKLCALSTKDEIRPKPEVIITTLNALVTLSYPNRALISKLITDLTETIQLKSIDPNTLSSLLRSLGILRWRPIGLMKMLFDYYAESSQTQARESDSKAIDQVVVALLHVAALVNFRYEGIEQFYAQTMRGEREESFNRNSRKWLNYVWSLVALNLADASHLRSVLSDDFYNSIANTMASPPVSHSDAMKLLNLRALAKYEFKMDDLQSKKVNDLVSVEINRSAEMQKFATKVREALNGIVNHPVDLRHDIQTPFGFTIDSEMHLSATLEPIPLTGPNIFENIDNNINSDAVNPDGQKRCALIYASFEDTIANSLIGEVVGHKQMIQRILKNFGYETIFLAETLINREKTSADLANRIETIIKEKFTNDD